MTLPLTQIAQWMDCIGCVEEVTEMFKAKSLPINWTWVKFGDIAKDRLIGLVRSSKEQSPSKKYPYIKMDSILLDGSLNLEITTNVDATDSELERYTLQKGDFLFNTRNSHELVGKTAVFNINEPNWLYNNNIMRIRFNDDINPYYLNLAFHSQLVRHQLEAAKNKTTSVCAIYDYQLVKLQIPLPPIATQKRIAAILDKADAVRRKRQEAIRLTEELLRSAFLEMFGDPVTNPKGWEMRKLDKLAKFVGGGTPSRKVPSYYQGDICWATPKDMGVDVLNDTKEHITQEAIEQSATKLVNPDCLLIVVKSKVLGRRLPIARTRVSTCFGQDLKAIVPYEASITRYLHRHLKFGERTLLEMARGVNTEGLTLEHLRSYDVMIPTKAEIDKFVEIDTQVENSQSKLKQTLADTDNLFNSLLQRAFRGDL
ncbi:MAG: restriction endonuclease subunit S [Elainellaceae cyanobacterium]